MGITPYSDVFDRFKNKLLKDPDFFLYSNLSLADAEQLVNDKCNILLEEAISELLLKCVPDVDFTDRDNALEVFNFELIEIEKDLLASLMKQKYLEEDEARLKVYMNNFSISEINVFSPAQERKTFMDMLKSIVDKNDAKISNYTMRDRKTGQYKSVVG